MKTADALNAVLAEFEFSPTALAREIGGDCKRQTVEQWIRNGRVPASWCPGCERVVEGRVTCEQLSGPSVRWSRIKDRKWPWHPGGRPVLEVATAPS